MKNKKIFSSLYRFWSYGGRSKRGLNFLRPTSYFCVHVLFVCFFFFLLKWKWCMIQEKVWFFLWFLIKARVIEYGDFCCCWQNKNSPWLSVPQFGDWDQKGGAIPDYSMDFTKIREMRKLNKRDPSRASLGNEEELINPFHNQPTSVDKTKAKLTTVQSDNHNVFSHHHPHSPSVRLLFFFFFSWIDFVWIEWLIVFLD